MKIFSKKKLLDYYLQTKFSITAKNLHGFSSGFVVDRNSVQGLFAVVVVEGKVFIIFRACS